MVNALNRRVKEFLQNYSSLKFKTISSQILQRKKNLSHERFRTDSLKAGGVLVLIEEDTKKDVKSDKIEK